MLPLKLEDPESGCIRPNNDVFCFDAGDNRVNEQLVSISNLSFISNYSHIFNYFKCVSMFINM